MIIKSPLDFSNTYEETLPMKRDEFPYLCMSADYSCLPNNAVTWHWHNEYEITYIKKGAAYARTLDFEDVLNERSFVFINSGVLHSYEAVDKECIDYTHFCNLNFLAGGIGDIAKNKYLYPIDGNKNLPQLSFHYGNAADMPFIELIEEANDIILREPFGYEFMIRNIMSMFFVKMYERLNLENASPSKRRLTDENRMKLMFDHIHKNYMNKISLEDISMTAGISTRECTRCFIRSIGIAPMQYVNEYRLEQAAIRLSHTDDKIISISEECGFSSGSYFTLCFKEKFGKLPKEYRQNIHTVSPQIPD